jgi:phosphoglycolate phosphatase-like HAD superfamily hydrolase
MIGDSWVDCETARGAGARVCLARFGFGYEGVDSSRLTGDEAIVDRPADIPAAVRQLLRLRA